MLRELPFTFLNLIFPFLFDRLFDKVITLLFKKRFLVGFQLLYRLILFFL